jgi:hypothetical protein
MNASTITAPSSDGAASGALQSVIDCDVFIGRAAGAPPTGASNATVELLLDAMARFGVEASVVYHVLAREHAPDIGNGVLIDELAGHPQLIPAFVLLPPHTGELPPLDQVIDQMRSAGARLARIFPSSELAGHRFSLREWCSGPLFSALETADIALAIDFSLFRRGEPPWDDIHSICSHHPALRVALIDVQGRNNRNLYALMGLFPQLFVSSGGLNVHAGIEDICERFGAHRLFLGSGWPTKSMGAAKLVVDRASITKAERSMILAGSARELLRLPASRTEVLVG